MITEAEMEEERKKDYSSGYDVSVDTDSTAFTEYNTENKSVSLIPRVSSNAGV